jgi:Xaa-Pro aminopeptidase
VKTRAEHKPRDVERIKSIVDALEQKQIDVLVCALPSNVLLLSGYWPVLGTTIAVVTRNGFVQVLAPDDEEIFAQIGWADVIETFSVGSLKELKTTIEVLRIPFRRLFKRLRSQDNMVIGFESRQTVEPASYVGMHLFGSALPELIVDLLPTAVRVSADDVLEQLRSTLSLLEQNRVRYACDIATETFIRAAQVLRPGLRETEVVSLIRSPLITFEENGEGITRADGFMFCMSGPNSAAAYAAYQCSSARRIESGDFVLIHCNSYVGGYWTDITRTFCIGKPDDRKLRMYEAVFAARQAALDTIRPGVKAAHVDRAARTVLSDYGFKKQFKHGLGHGVGFAAINHNALPRLHPASEDMLESGMIFNIEPAIYFEGFGGIRHCDMVLMTGSGPEVLTPFQSTVESLILA